MRFAVLLLILALPVFAEPLAVTQSPAAVSMAVGQMLRVSVTLTNTLAPREPIVLVATVAWRDERGLDHIAEATTRVTVIQPIRIAGYSAGIEPFTYLPDTAKLDGVPVSAVVEAGTLSLAFQRTLVEGQSAALEYVLMVTTPHG